MKAGRISEVGSFKQLLDHNGAFAEFLRNYFTDENEIAEELEKLTEEGELAIHTPGLILIYLDGREHRIHYYLG